LVIRPRQLVVFIWKTLISGPDGERDFPHRHSSVRFARLSVRSIPFNGLKFHVLSRMEKRSPILRPLRKIIVKE
jgi:hypothetical protein